MITVGERRCRWLGLLDSPPSDTLRGPQWRVGYEAVRFFISLDDAVPQPIGLGRGEKSPLVQLVRCITFKTSTPIILVVILPGYWRRILLLVSK